MDRSCSAFLHLLIWASSCTAASWWRRPAPQLPVDFQEIPVPLLSSPPVKRTDRGEESDPTQAGLRGARIRAVLEPRLSTTKTLSPGEWKGTDVQVVSLCELWAGSASLKFVFFFHTKRIIPQLAAGEAIFLPGLKQGQVRHFHLKQGHVGHFHTSKLNIWSV